MRKFFKTVLGGGDRPETIPASPRDSKKRSLKQPSKAQVQRCEWLGLEIKPGMSGHDIWLMVNDALRDPKIKARDDEYLARQWALQETEDRKEYGDAAVDNYKKMQAICQAGVHHIVIYTTGKTVAADVLELESVSIDKGKTGGIVTVEACRPKIRKSMGKAPRIEWNKEIAIRFDQILELDTLPAGIDPLDLDGFEKARARAEQLKGKHLHH